MLNDKEYWNNLFVENEENKKRIDQTKFFAELALKNLPKWVIEDIEDQKMTICDAGCGEGIGAAVWKKNFQNNDVSGFDFSDNAIEWAKRNNSDCTFYVDNIKSFEKKYDVVYSSNVLEHFFNADSIFENLVQHALKFCVLLLPFREYYRIEEHASTFDFNSFPLEINKQYKLCYYKPITMVGEQEKYWFGEQILLIYINNDFLKERKLTLEHIYNGYIEERTNIINQYSKQVEEQTDIINQYIKQVEENKSLISDFVSKKEEIDVEIRFKDETINQLKKREEVLINEIEFIKKTLEAETEKKENLIKDLNENVENLSDLLEKYNIDHDRYLSNNQEIIRHLEIIQSGRIYRTGLALKRFKMQIFHRKERKDFLKWFIYRLLKKNVNAKGLNEFDDLEIVKRNIRNLEFDSIYLENNKETNLLWQSHIKETKKIFIFASVPYFDVGGGQRSAQLAKTFNTLGYDVYYIFGFECTEEDVPEMHIPAKHFYIDDVKMEWYKTIMDKESMVIFEIPYLKFQPYLEYAKEIGAYVVYEHIDNWDSSLGCLFYDENVFKEFLKKANLITVTARKLGEKIEEHGIINYVYLANAVNTEVFEPLKKYECPKDLVRGKKTLLYFGSLWGDWFDWEKLEYLAKKRKDCEINLIGDYSNCKERVKNSPANIHFLGLKKQTELPAYLAYTDFALLPFKNCEIGSYVSPLKIFEYIAMNVKVLATPLDDIQNYPNVICSDDKDVWVASLDNDNELIDSSVFISQNNWFARCGELLKLENKTKKVSDKISIIVLNYNNMRVIKRCVETLIAHNKRYSYEIIVVDNGSTDGSYEMLQKEYENRIILLKNDVNGCSSGRNLGVKNATGKYVCFLDSDQWILTDYWLDSALDILKKHRDIGAVGWNAGWFTPGNTTGPIVDYIENRAIDSSQIWYRTDIAYLATSGMLMSRNLFNDIEGFDTFYDPTCFEDTDLSLKIRNEGYELAYSPYWGIMHLPHQTTKSGSKRHTELMNRNGRYFYDKWQQIDEKLLEYYL